MQQEDKMEEVPKTFQEKIKELNDAIEDAKTNMGDVEVFDAMLAKADYLNEKATKDEAISAFLEAYGCNAGVGKKIDIRFKLLLIYIDRKDLNSIKENIQIIKELLEQGGDWERKNRLKVFEGMYLIMIRDFKAGAVLLLDSVKTFTCTELFSYLELIKYAVITGMVSLERPIIKDKLIHSPEVNTQIREIPYLKEFAHSLYNCDYKGFFQAFLHIIDILKKDRFLKEHSQFYIREIRIVAYSQYLEAYKSVKLQTMAEAFGIGVELLDKELCNFIASGRINSKIDKVAGIVESDRPDRRIHLYQKIIRQGDFLLNRIQKLSRALEL